MKYEPLYWWPEPFSQFGKQELRPCRDETGPEASVWDHTQGLNTMVRARGVR